MFTQALPFLLISASALAAPSPDSGRLALRDDQPHYPYDAATTSYCTWWFDSDGTWTCQDILDVYGVTLADFTRWNPSLASSCGTLPASKSFCVEAIGEPSTSTTTSKTSTTSSTSSTITSKTTSSTTLVTTTTTSTSTGNGIATPTPTQPGMVSNCDAFYFVKSGDTCSAIATANGISLDQFITWNPQVGGSSCTGLWASVYVCVSIIGHTPSTTTSSSVTTTTTTGNGITTPTPTMPGMVSNCDAFYFVKSGDTCSAIASANGITLAQFTTWNTQVGGSACTSLWANAYVCVSIIGHTPTTTTKATTTTSTGNGITTPTPTQTNMTKNCKKFYFVKSGDTCAAIASANGITTAQFISWNPDAKSDCTGLWANTYACVAVL